MIDKLKIVLIQYFVLRPNTTKITNIFLRGISILAFLIWILKIDIPYLDSEAFFAGLLLLSAFFNEIYQWLLEEAEYSPALALAYGYVENFVEPTITQLISEGSQPTLHIYRPKTLDNLFDKNIERIKGEIRLKNFKISEIVLKANFSRTRDLLIIEKEEGEHVYFDFPGTLKSLIPYVEYKISSKSNESRESEKAEFAKKLINIFFMKLNSLLVKKGISNFVKITNSDLNIA